MDDNSEIVIKSLLLPLNNITMLISNANVAEIVSGFTISESDSKDEWILGETPWRGNTIPVVSLDVLMGDLAPENPNKSNFVVFYSLSNDSKFPYYAVKMNGIPKFEFASKSLIEELPKKDTNDFFVKDLILSGQAVSIPNLAKLESLF